MTTLLLLRFIIVLQLYDVVVESSFFSHCEEEQKEQELNETVINFLCVQLPAEWVEIQASSAA